MQSYFSGSLAFCPKNNRATSITLLHISVSNWGYLVAEALETGEQLCADPADRVARSSFNVLIVEEVALAWR